MLSVNEAVILAGGRGSRLGDLTLECPKPLLPVRGYPFLVHLILELSKKGINRVILSVGYKAEKIEEYFRSCELSLPEIDFCRESEPLGTGGAIKKSLGYTRSSHVLVLNGDSYVEFSLNNLVAKHDSNSALITLCSAKLPNASRYGIIKFDDAKVVYEFLEKQPNVSGWINCGCYLLDREQVAGVLSNIDEKEFSFEREFLEKEVSSKKLFAYLVEGQFLDIGIPSDYELAQSTLFL